MELIDNPRYLDSLRQLGRDFPRWAQLNGKTILISGVSGMLGSFLTDAIMLRNETLPNENKCRIIGLGRNKAAAKKRFEHWIGNEVFTFIEHDVSVSLDCLSVEPDYCIHAASTTHPVAYATEPVNTILTNVLGTHNLLKLAASKKSSRFLLLSSVEIYGENRGDVEYFAEDYGGYLNCNTLRAGYPEAKRTSEALCQAYIEQENVDAVILRLPRCYGPSMRMNDSKAIAQFIKKAVNGENIVLKSAGNQLYSYAHVYDAVAGMLWVLCVGEQGQAYNLGDEQSNVTLREIAETAAQRAGTRVVFDLPNGVEAKGYSTASKALLSAKKLSSLGWNAKWDIKTGIRDTIDILKQVNMK